MVLPFGLKGQRVAFHDKTPFASRQQITNLFSGIDSLSSKYDFSIGKCYLLKKDSSYYAMIDGHSYVFQWDGKIFDNLYKGKYHGYNFSSYKFLHNGIIHSYGGYGFWSLRPDRVYWCQCSSILCQYSGETTLLLFTQAQPSSNQCSNRR